MTVDERSREPRRRERDMTWEIRQGDALERLREMPDESVQCCVSSPPYFGLRDYGTGEWEGGDPDCDHQHETAHQRQGASSLRVGRANIEDQRNENFRDVCGRCGAQRVDRQVGLEQTPDEYVSRLVAVFAEVRRVLRSDGTLWLNMGDSYNNADKWGGGGANTGKHTRAPDGSVESWKAVRRRWSGTLDSKPKDLLGVPWLLAFALRADGWYLRSDIIWSKPNPMPESVTDRPTSAHEHLFLLSKSARYFYNAEAIREDGKDWSSGGPGIGILETQHYGAGNGGNAGLSTLAQRYKDGAQPAGRNKRSVWTVATQPYAEAHFATFPPKLIEPCILAGSAERACGVCGAPWERVMERGDLAGEARIQKGPRPAADERGVSSQGLARTNGRTWRERVSKGYRPTCAHGDDAGRSLVLDPFAGSGTTGVVSRWYDRDFIGIELNPEYAEMARRRIATDGRLGHAAYRPKRPAEAQGELF